MQSNSYFIETSVIGSGHDLLPDGNQAIAYTNADSLSAGP